MSQSAAERIAQEIITSKYRSSSKLWFRRWGTVKDIRGIVMRYPIIKPRVVQERIFDHNDECLKARKPCRQLIVKPRKDGASTGVQGVMYHRGRLFPGRSGAIMGDVIGTSDTIFEIYRTFAENDKMDWGDGFSNLAIGDKVNNQTDDITLPNGSTYKKVTAGSSNANRSGTIQFANSSETAYYKVVEGRDPLTSFLGSWHDMGEESYGAMDSTSNGASGKFFDYVMDERNGWKKIFVGWHEEPDYLLPFEHTSEEAKFQRDMDRREHELQVRYSLTLPQLNWLRDKLLNKCGGSVEQLNREFPSSLEEAFNQNSALRFSITVLENMERRAKVVAPRKGDFVTQADATVSFMDENNGTIKIFEEPRIGCKYLQAFDACTGEDQQTGDDPDWHSVGVLRDAYIDPRNGEHFPPLIAAHHHSRMDISIVCDGAAALSRYYGNCLSVIETNGCGLYPVKRMRELNVPVWQRKAKESSTGGQMVDGWYSSKPLKKTIIDILGGALLEWRPEKPTLDIMDMDIISELKTMIVDCGTPMAMAGKHDDTVMMLAMLYFLRTNATLYKEPERKKIDLTRLLRREGWVRQKTPRY